MADDNIASVAKRAGWIPTEWLFKFVVILGLVANLWMQSHYVTVERYSADQKEQAIKNEQFGATLVSLDKSMALLVEQQKAKEVQDRLLADHEARLRALESKK